MTVGADDVRSVVRRQMLPDHVLLDTEGRDIFGKTLITDDLFEHVPKETGEGISRRAIESCESLLRRHEIQSRPRL